MTTIAPSDSDLEQFERDGYFLVDHLFSDAESDRAGARAAR